MRSDRPVPLAMQEVLGRTDRAISTIPTAFELLGLVLLSGYFVFVPFGELFADADLKAAMLVSSMPLVISAPWLLRRLGTRRARRYVRDSLSRWMREAAERHHASVAELEPVLRPAFAEKMREDS